MGGGVEQGLEHLAGAESQLAFIISPRVCVPAKTWYERGCGWRGVGLQHAGCGGLGGRDSAGLGPSVLGCTLPWL